MICFPELNWWFFSEEKNSGKWILSDVTCPIPRSIMISEGRVILGYRLFSKGKYLCNSKSQFSHTNLLLYVIERVQLWNCLIFFSPSTFQYPFISFESLFLFSLAHANQQTLGPDQISKDIYLVISSPHFSKLNNSSLEKPTHVGCFSAFWLGIQPSSFLRLLSSSTSQCPLSTEYSFSLVTPTVSVGVYSQVNLHFMSLWMFNLRCVRPSYWLT